jgi:predicted ferric reductase
MTQPRANALGCDILGVTDLHIMIPSSHTRKIFFWLFLVLNLLVIIGFWWSTSGALYSMHPMRWQLGLGRLAGLLAVYFILVQFLLAGRAVWVERAFGLDRLFQAHHLNGNASLFFILTHPLFMVTAYSLGTGSDFFSQMGDFIVNYSGLLAAFVAVMLFVIIVGLSVYITRKHLKYETWYFIHLLTYAAVLLAFSHQLSLGGDFVLSSVFVTYWYVLYASVFGVVLTFRFLRPAFNSYRYRFAVAGLTNETADTVSVSIKGSHLNSYRVEPGQFFILRFLAKKFWWQAHPFSLSAVKAGDAMRVTIKNSGDFTSQISKLKKDTPVLVDGPYGTFTAHYPAGTKYLFIAGGVGITPIRALIEQLAPSNDLILLYGSKTPHDVIFKDELDRIASQGHMVIHYVMNGDPSFAGEKGMIDREKIERLVKDVTQREVYLCGPKPMMDGVRKSLSGLGVQRDKIHFEQFSL